MKKTLVINGEIMGCGSDELGHTLMGSFLRKLWGSNDKPEQILFYNSGVKLMARGSPVLDALDGLSEAGVDLVACGTCVTFYNLKDKMAVGRVSDMNEISAVMLNSDKTITI